MKRLVGVVIIFILLGAVGWRITQKTPTGIVLGAKTDQLKERLDKLGLPALKEEGTILHTHQHLDLYINGTLAIVPAEIGIDPNQTYIAPIHTHDTSGIIHVESPVEQKFYLGQFLSIWGINLPDKCSYFVNGKQVNRDTGGIELTAHEEIAIVCGQSIKVPKSYNFPAGY